MKVKNSEILDALADSDKVEISEDKKKVRRVNNDALPGLIVKAKDKVDIKKRDQKAQDKADTKEEKLSNKNKEETGKEGDKEETKQEEEVEKQEVDEKGHFIYG